MKKLGFTLAITCIAAIAGTANATLILSSSFTGFEAADYGGSTTNSLSPTWTMAGPVTAASDITGFYEDGAAEFKFNSGADSQGWANSSANVASPRNFFGVSFTFTTSGEVTLDSLTMDYAIVNSGGALFDNIHDISWSISGGTLGADITDSRNSLGENGPTVNEVDSEFFDFTNTTIGAGTYTVNLTVDPASTRFASFRGVSIAAIPEPSSLALVATAIAALAAYRRR